ncbi:hypothetical protein DYB25_009319 [Aphanomyces astaci]|uniref:Kinetochore protein Nuf2 N-terminal domain-containing protein n=2 Tax=Aphanomyces astaci TaxID=112090 RepID=A0A397AME6_APHAT|nr:hypothetical protein DYB25_009319 [Aphanomyces astaci]
MSIYSFPVLKMTGIIQFIRDSKLSISEEDIKNCDPAAVRRFFEAFFEVILDISKDDLTQPALSGLSALQHPNLHESSVPELAFFRTSKKLLEACGVDDFTWRDIQKPTLKRLRYLLSAIINFSKFKEERKVHFDQYLKTTVPSPSHVLRSLTYLDTLQDNLLRTKQQVEDENVALRRQLEELQSKQAAEAPALQVVIDECAAMEVDIGVLNTRQSVLQPEVKALKAQVAQLNDDIVPITFIRMNLNDLLEAIEGDMNKVKVEKENVTQLHQTYEGIVSKAKLAVAHKARVEILLDQRRDQLEVYKQQARTKMQAAEHAVASAAKEVDQWRQHKLSNEHQVAAKLQAVQETHAMLNHDREAFELTLKDMEETYVRMERKVKAYTKMVTEIVGSSSVAAA